MRNIFFSKKSPSVNAKGITIVWIPLLEYLELLKDLNKEDPELESFIVSEPVTFRQIQETLYDRSIVIDYFFCEGKLNIWTITNERVDFFQISIDNQKISSEIKGFISDIQIIRRIKNLGELSGIILFVLWLIKLIHSRQ